MDWGFWVLFASWVITYGLFVYWAWKYHRLKKKYDEEKSARIISDETIRRRDEEHIALLGLVENWEVEELRQFYMRRLMEVWGSDE